MLKESINLETIAKLIKPFNELIRQGFPNMIFHRYLKLGIASRLYTKSILHVLTDISDLKT